MTTDNRNATITGIAQPWYESDAHVWAEGREVNWFTDDTQPFQNKVTFNSATGQLEAQVQHGVNYEISENYLDGPVKYEAFNSNYLAADNDPTWLIIHYEYAITEEVIPMRLPAETRTVYRLLKKRRCHGSWLDRATLLP